MNPTNVQVIRDALFKPNEALYELPLPDPYDGVIGAAIRLFSGLAVEEGHALRESLTDAERQPLGTFAFRMAELAVIEKDPQHIAIGLLAMAIQDLRPEPGYDLMTLTLHIRSAELLGVAAMPCFEAAAQYAISDARERMLGCARRAPRLAEMGLIETGSGGLTADFAGATVRMDISLYPRACEPACDRRATCFTYRGVTALGLESDERFEGQPGLADLGHDELDLLEDRCLEHRFLFASGVALAIRFADFTME
jgi:hypothetical protein